MIGSSENRISYNGNGIATEFAYTFKILEKSDIKVLHVAIDGTEELLTKDYYVDMEKSVVLYPGYAPGAEIPEQNRPPILPVGERLVLYREVPITQESALDKHWPFNVIEAGLDKLTIICQQLFDRLQRSFYVSESTSTNFDTKVPIEAGKTFRVKDDGTGFEVTEDPGKVIDGAKALLKQTTEQAVNAQNAATKSETALSLIQKYKAVWFNSVADMKANTDLSAGAYVCTAGYYEPNDGGGASYLIRVKLESDTDDGGSLHELQNSLVAELIIENGTVCPEQFGAKGDGISDDTAAFQSTITNSTVCVINNDKHYIISSQILVPVGHCVVGTTMPMDLLKKENSFVGEYEKGICIIDEGGFVLNGLNTIKDLYVFYPNQKYNLSDDSTQADGIEAFNVYKPLFDFKGLYSGADISNIVFLGGSTFFYSSYQYNPEKLNIRNIRGSFTDTFIIVENCSEMMDFSDILINPNSVNHLISSDKQTNFYTKIAKNCDVFTFGKNGAEYGYGCDGSHITNCFAYCTRRFIALYGKGNSVHVINSSADICHEFYYTEASVKPFGTFISNCCVTPNVYKPIINDAESDNSPCLIRLNGHDEIVEVANCKVFGSGTSLVKDSASCTYVVCVREDGIQDRVNLVNCSFIANELQKGFNKIGNNNIVLAQGVVYRVLTCTNVTLNGYTKDTNINKCKVLLTEYTIAEGIQEISGIGFRASNVEIIALINGMKASSSGTSDGSLAYCDADMSGEHWLSGGTAIIVMLGTSVSDRVYAEFKGFTDDGFKLNWGSAGSLAPIGKIARLIIKCYR